MTVEEHDVSVGGTSLRVREVGARGGEPVIHFHGTPGSRLELAFADDIVETSGAHLLAFDRPGYGRSAAAPFSLVSVAEMAIGLADQFGFDHFRTIGWSGGGPFALITAALAGDRVPAVGVIAGPGPFQLVPGALDELSDTDRTAEQLLPADPQAACEGFARGFNLSPALESTATLYQAFEPLLSASDRQIWAAHSEHLLTDIREAMAQGALGCGWDNVAWIGSWAIELSAVQCPVLLWYGTEDRMAPSSHAHWLEINLPDGRLTTYEGEGHLLALTRLRSMLEELTEV